MVGPIATSSGQRRLRPSFRIEPPLLSGEWRQADGTPVVATRVDSSVQVREEASCSESSLPYLTLFDSRGLEVADERST